MKPLYKCRGDGYSEDPSECPGGVEDFLPGDLRVKLSKFLSGILRHYPWRIGVKLDRAGWAPLDGVVAGIRSVRGFEWVKSWHVEAVALLDGKGRFEIRGGYIRARYGHTIPVKVEPLPGKPPRILYHGTPLENLGSILSEGIKRMRRIKVHLSVTLESAIEVGARRSREVAVLEVDVACLESMGLRVEKASPLVYTVDYVPPKCIKDYKVFRL